MQSPKVIIVMGKVSEFKSNYYKLISSSIKKLLANKSTIHQKTAHHDQAGFASGMLGRLNLFQFINITQWWTDLGKKLYNDINRCRKEY